MTDMCLLSAVSCHYRAGAAGAGMFFARIKMHGQRKRSVHIYESRKKIPSLALNQSKKLAIHWYYWIDKLFAVVSICAIFSSLC